MSGMDTRYLYCRIYRGRMGLFDRLLYDDMGATLNKAGANILVERSVTHVEVPFETKAELREKLDPVLDILKEWERRRIASCVITDKPLLPPKPPIKLSPPGVKEKVMKYARAIWRGVRRVPWGKIATILAKSAYIGAKHLGLAAKEITEMVVEEIKKKPEREQVPLLLVVQSLIEARRRGEITEEEYLETIKLIGKQIGVPLEIRYV